MCDAFLRKLRVFWCFNKPDRIRAHSILVKDDPDDKYVDIGNPMIHYKPISKADVAKYNKYTYHYGLFWLLPIAIITNVVSNSDLFGRPSSKETRRLISGVVVTLSMIIILIFSVISFIAIKQNSKSLNGSNEKQLAQNMKIPRSLSMESFASLNNLFDIPSSSPSPSSPTMPDTINDNSIYDMNRTYYGMLLILSIIYVNVNTSIIEVCFYLLDEDVCIQSPDEMTPNQIGLCVVNRTNYAKIYIIVLAFITIATSYFEVATNCKIRIDQIKQKLLQRYEKMDGSIINQIEFKIHRRLREWKKSKDLDQRKIEILITFLIVLSVQIVILSNSAFSSDVPIGAMIFCIWMNIGNSVMFTIIVFFVNSAAQHYSFPTIIMNELSLQINCKSLMDLISWWELRKYYLVCIIDIHGSGIAGALFTALTGDIIAVIALAIMRFALNWDETDPAQYMLMTILIVYVTAITFWGISIAVDFHKNQLNHIQMINKEKLRLIDDENQCKHGIIECIELDIVENSHPFKIFGVRLTQTFMIFLQSTAFTIAFAFVFGG